jgi:membrane-associated phospholipid phosphatase
MNIERIAAILTFALLSAGSLLAAPSIPLADDDTQAGAQIPQTELPRRNGDTAAASPDEKHPTSASTQTTGLGTLFRDLGSDFKHLPSSDSLLVGSVGGALALEAHHFDSTFNQRLANDGGFFKAGNLAGSTVTLMGASAVAYTLGRATGQTRVTHVGLDLLRAQIVTEAMVESMKFTIRRARPDGSSGYAFPSGHAAMAFATATVIERHHGFLWAIPTYTLATYVATSRLHDNVHNLSDVVFGATVGTIAGRTVTRHGRSNFALVPFATPDSKGVLLVHNW